MGWRQAGEDERWERMVADGWAASQRGRHAQAERMCRAAVGAASRRAWWALAARAGITLARVMLERGEAGRAVEACAGARASADRAGRRDLMLEAVLWSGWALADDGRYDEAESVLAAARAASTGDAAWAAAGAAAVRTLCAIRRGERPGDVTDGVNASPAEGVADGLTGGPTDGPALPGSPLAGREALHARAWGVRVARWLSCGQVFRAGQLVARGRSAAIPAGSEAAAEWAVAHLAVTAASGAIDMVAETARLALTGPGRHRPWVRLRVLALWREAAERAQAPEAARLGAAVRRLAARSPAGWGASVAGGVEGPSRRAPAVQRAVEDAPEVAGLVGSSTAVRALRRELATAARTGFPVLIEGETGSGKELVARGLHALGPRAGGPFRALNCAALPESLADADLFGHARGAFTGAAAARGGLLEEASGGTLFLDEVLDLTPRTQASLLRALQEQEVRRLGEAHVRRVDLRLVAACNRSLRAEAESGAFRPDLYYRLAAIRLRVPPLRERLGDLPALVAVLWPPLAAQAGSRAMPGADVLGRLAQHRWPGNVRELQHVLMAMAIRAPVDGVVPASVLPEDFGEPEVEALARARGRFERAYVRDALARHGAVVGETARALGLSRQGLRKVLARTEPLE